ncbi:MULTISPECIES: GntR family transcriptional regulator [unclassified Mesorhizobium]|uniref:GntR family transcriptional regulator n=1 Tax=unclassified Mesorhizobium TaxID=325217 RepID=UPI0024154E11|nr:MULTISPECIES: GntR family transcriptional regulator [unclassified Mesorhizobium]MDG4889954.1 GntR family transcriptional regulator [Mesorhizobium sp. WSM4887]MDG4904097.1 GntR family transcriptional regulator [Mesorhizobium sp. WSM4962]MDG4909124.1 GntR family transcriptional regulator [Mesorhizobium sp. WSM4898]MDG4921748.1 GntR family transcriptional regulator [Mesorhizobium sp. WSM4989]
MDQIAPLFTPDQLDGRTSKSAQVYELIRGAIISLKMPPGSAVVEKDICAQLGISRTPLREAILQLAKENLVKIAPSDGTFVNKIVLKEVLQGQLVRDTVEFRLTRLAARNFKPEFEKDFELALFKQKAAAKRQDVDEFFALDNEFHALICTCAGFPDAWLAIHNSTGQLDRVRRQAFPLERHFSTVFEEHCEMYEMIKRHDEDGVARVFQVQLDSTFPSIEILRAQRPDLLSGDADVSIADIR